MPNHAHEPTEKDREQVLAMAGYGLPQTDIAVVMGISKPTLIKYYREELDKGIIIANSKVIESLFINATKKYNVTAQIFWAKNRCGWVDVKQMDQQVTHKFDGLTDRQRYHLLAVVINQAGAGSAAEVIDAEATGDARSSPDKPNKVIHLAAPGRATNGGA